MSKRECTYFNGLLQVVFDVLHFGGLLTTVELKRKKKIILHPDHQDVAFIETCQLKSIVFCSPRSCGFRSVEIRGTQIKIN